MKNIAYQNKKIKIILFLFFCLSIHLLNAYFYKKREIIKYINFENTEIAIFINDEKTYEFPKKTDQYSFDEEKSFCNNGVTISWSYETWSSEINFSNYQKENNTRTFCNLYFKEDVYQYDYTGSKQDFLAKKEGYYQIELWGSGGSRKLGEENLLGYGSYTSGEIYLKKEEKLYIYVGQEPQSCTPYYSCTGEAYNGGGSGGFFTVSHFLLRDGGGGGATDIRLVDGDWNTFEGLKSRIMVAAGGTYGVSGGGLTGYTSKLINGGGAVHGTGASQTSGGTALENATNGTFGKGGTGYVSYPEVPNFNDAFGGSGGYYGGGGGYGGAAQAYAIHYGQGGSGSSFISGHNGCDAIEEESSINNIMHTGNPNHYSDFIFLNTKMIDGEGYLWQEKKENLERMPNPQGGYYELGKGHLGNGYARITFLGKK